MNHLELQTKLADWGYDPGPLDGVYGRRTRTALLQALTDGKDTPLSEADIRSFASRLDIPVSRVYAFREVEAAGAGFANDRAKILPEPHRFSKATGRRFDATNPTLSYPKWGTRPYPKTQEARYEQLLDMVGLDVDAGLASCSYGTFQILGENYAMCGYRSPFAFVMDQSRSELDQLEALGKFLEARGLLPALRRGDWVAVASAYNGPAFRTNRYDTKLAEADRRWAAKLK